MRNSFFSIMLSLVMFILLQYLIQGALIALGITGIWFFILFDLILAFIFAWIQYPRIYRKQAIRDPRFHMSFAMYFAILVVLDLIFRF